MKDNCTPIASNCVTWTGPNIPCIKLCKGDSITEVLYNFAMSYCDLLSQLDPSKYNLACLNDKKCPPDTFQKLIQLLINKICEVDKEEGPQGPPGNDGNDGVDGDTIEVTVLGTGGVNCPCGGIQVQIFDNTATLKAEEFVCNGCDGDDGEQGAQGDQGLQGPPGNDGEDGLSAYEIWLGEGNTGTEQDFLDSITATNLEQTKQYILALQCAGDFNCF